MTPSGASIASDVPAPSAPAVNPKGSGGTATGPLAWFRALGGERRLRLYLAVILLVGFALSAASLGTTWWMYSSSSGGATQTVLFNPGSTYSVECSGCGAFNSGSFSYSNFGGSLGSLYQGLEGGLIAAVALAGLATLFGLLILVGRAGSGSVRMSLLLGVVAGLLLLALSIWVASAQPGAFGSGDSFAGLSKGGASPLATFWGSSDAGGSSASWGASFGWYAALVGGLLVLTFALALIVLPQGRALRSPARAARRVATVAVAEPSAYAAEGSAPIPTSSRGYTAPPTSGPVQASAKTPKPVLVTHKPAPDPTMDCPACGYQNSVRARTCGYCQRAMATPTEAIA